MEFFFFFFLFVHTKKVCFFTGCPFSNKNLHFFNTLHRYNHRKVLPQKVSKSAVSSLRKWPEKMYVRVFAGEVFLFFCVFFAKKIAQKNLSPHCTQKYKKNTTLKLTVHFKFPASGSKQLLQMPTLSMHKQMQKTHTNAQPCSAFSVGCRRGREHSDVQRQKKLKHGKVCIFAVFCARTACLTRFLFSKQLAWSSANDTSFRSNTTFTVKNGAQTKILLSHTLPFSSFLLFSDVQNTKFGKIHFRTHCANHSQTTSRYRAKHAPGPSCCF